MVDFANLDTRAASLEILQRYEAKLKTLDLIPQPVIEEGITRVQTLAHIQHTRFKAAKTSRPWEAWARDVRAIECGSYQKPFTFSDMFELRATTDQPPNFDTPFDGLIKPDILKMTPSFFPTFGTSTAPEEDTTDKAIEPAYNVIMLDSHKPAKTPVVPRAAQTKYSLSRALERLKAAPQRPAPTPTPKTNIKPFIPRSRPNNAAPHETASQLTNALTRLRKSAKRPKRQPAPTHHAAPAPIQLAFEF